MHYSGYQIESVLRRLRRLHGLLRRRNGAPPSAGSIPKQARSARYPSAKARRHTA